jgi:hypothetical protein
LLQQKGAQRPGSKSGQVTSKRLLLVLSAVIPLLLVAAPAGADDSGGGGVAAPTSAPAPVAVDAAVPDAEAAQTETTPTTPGGEEQPGGGQPTDTEGTVGPEVTAPNTGAGESAGGLPRTGLEVAAFAMIGLGLLMAGLALRPTSSWPPPRDRLSRSTPHR